MTRQELDRQIEVRALLTAEAYRDHRDACKSCTCDELCDEGYALHAARTKASDAASEWQ